MYDSRSKTNERRIEIKGNGIMKRATKIATASLAFVVTFCAVQGDAKELAKSAPPDDCLAAPNSPAPDGSQWRYRGATLPLALALAGHARLRARSADPRISVPHAGRPKDLSLVVRAHFAENQA